MIKTSFLDPVFNSWLLPMLQFNSAMTILFMSLVITVIVTVVYKYTTNQTLMKQLKDDLKRLQDEMKKLKDKPDKMLKKQQEMMSKNMEYTKHSFKSTLFTLLPLLLIFGWMNAHLAYYSIEQGQNFDVLLTLKETPTTDSMVTLAPIDGINVVDIKGAANSALFVLNGKAGDYDALTFKYKNETCSAPLYIGQNKEEFKHSTPINICKNTQLLKRIEIKYPQLKPFGNLSILGWHPGWLGTYILSSIVFSMVLRKIMNVY